MEKPEVYMVGWNKSVSGNLVPVYCEKLILGDPNPRGYNFLTYSFGSFDEIVKGIESRINGGYVLAQEIENQIGFYPHNMNTGKALLSDKQERLMNQKNEIFHYNNELKSALDKIKSQNGSWDKSLEETLAKIRRRS